MQPEVTAQQVISRLRAVTGIKSERELSLFFGYGATTMTSKRQRNSVPYEECTQLAVEHGISLDWLVLGRGEAPPGVIEPRRETAEEASHADEFVDVPLYDLQAAAGDGRLFDEERIKCILHFRRDWLATHGLFPENLVAVETAGDSMEPTLRDSDTVLVNRADTSGDGVYLLRMGESLRIKRVQRRADRSLLLSSDNELYESETIHPEHMDQIEILGRCHSRSGKIY